MLPVFPPTLPLIIEDPYVSLIDYFPSPAPFKTRLFIDPFREGILDQPEIAPSPNRLEDSLLPSYFFFLLSRCPHFPYEVISTVWMECSMY